VDQIAKYFLMSTGAIRKALNELKEDGLAEDLHISRSKQGPEGRNARLWAYRHPVAVPNVAPEPRPPERASTPRQWSVYDDRSYD
jgi:hypothetical protein